MWLKEMRMKIRMVKKDYGKNENEKTEMMKIEMKMKTKIKMRKNEAKTYNEKKWKRK